MKKLITILGAITISASAATLVVACSDDDIKYGNIFIDSQGNIKIDANDLLNWYQNTYGSLGKNPNKYVADFYNIFAVAVFVELTQKDANGAYIENDTTKAMDQSSLAEIRKIWGDESTAGTIQYQAKIAMEKARTDVVENDDLDLSDWLKDLEKKFPAVNDNQTDLENAWISDFILNDADWGAYANLTKILAFNGMSTSTKWQKGTQNYRITNANGTTQHELLLNEFKSTFGDKKISDLTGNITATEGITAEQQLTIINIINSIGGKYALVDNKIDPFKVEFINNLDGITWDNFFSSISYMYENDQITDKTKTINQQPANFLSSTDLSQLGTNGVIDDDFINYAIAKPANLTKIVNFIPTFEVKSENGVDQITNKSADPLSDGRIGILNESQRYLSNKYFEEKKPVAVSEVTLNFSSSATVDLNKEISMNLFIDSAADSNTLTNYFNGFQTFFDNVLKSTEVNAQTGLSFFESFYRGANKGSLTLNDDASKWASANLTSKNDKGLLTIDNENYSNTAKYAIYDFLSGGEHATKFTSLTGDLNHQNTNIPEASFTNDTSNVLQSDGAKTLYSMVEATRQYDESNINESQNLYTVINEDLGIIAYIEDGGLHFVKIDGYNLIKSDIPSTSPTDPTDPAEYVTPTISTTTSETENSKERESQAYDLIFNASNYSSYLMNQDTVNKTTQSKAENDASTSQSWDQKNIEVQNNLINMRGVNDYTNAINYEIENDYERFLVNSSIVKTLDADNALYTFDYVSDVAAQLTNTDGDFSSLGQWLWLYMKEALNKTTDESLFSTFFISDDTVNQDAISELMDQIQLIEQTNNSEIVNQFDNTNNTWSTSVNDNAEKQNNEIVEANNNAKNFIPNQSIITEYDEVFSDSTIWSNNPTLRNVITSAQTINLVFNYDKIKSRNEGDE